MSPSLKFALLAAGLCGLASGGCGERLPAGSLVLTQTPAGAKPSIAKDILEARYPVGSRVVLASPPYDPGKVRVLSRGLVAAGSPVVTPEGRLVYFVGRKDMSGPWQVFQSDLSGGRPKAVTGVPGGAMDPAVMAGGDVVFCSPVPALGQTWKGAPPPAVYSQTPGLPPRRLTHGVSAAVEPTVLADGRILFVSAQPKPTNSEALHLALFTIHNDGTEITAFAGQHDGTAAVHRPRELDGGRIAFLAANSDATAGELWAEAVRTARPFGSRERLFNFPSGRCRSVEPDGKGGVVACIEMPVDKDRSRAGSCAVFCVDLQAKELGQPLFDAPDWNDIEATRVAPRTKPMGHLSTMVPTRQTGTVLCLDANFTTYRELDGSPQPAVKSVRVLSSNGARGVQALGEVQVEADGSFMVEVPADAPLGFAAIAADGRVLRWVPPTVWLRGGENRTCIGCHEPHNHSPRNVRPLAVNKPPVRLTNSAGQLTQAKP
jgi:hypothetical protein